MFTRSRESVPTPDWFTRALAQEPERMHVEIAGCRIHLRVWGQRGAPPLLLVHGGAAHSGWWDHIAPFLSDTYRVIAPDLSGHGDSQSRTAYDIRIWAQEVMDAVAAAGASGYPTIVGHSLGGWVAASAATHYGENINSIVIIDSPLRDNAPEEPLLRDRGNRAPGNRSRAEAIARFRPVPAQDEVLPYIAHHIAGESVHRTAAGWTWKFDPAIFGDHLLDQTPFEKETMAGMMTKIACRVAFVRCEHGVVQPEMAQRIREVLQLRGPFVELAKAGHHPMLDQPMPLIATLRTLLEIWSIT
ncbi:alpha/beta hydrolase [Mycolicibacterium setense]|nr:alpha/beta hydrolase [Mycolicibacterium setense]